MEQFEKTAQEWITIQNKLREECLEYLTKVLKSHNNQISWNSDDFDEDVCISYDGGNHPEYASNLYSVVNGVKLENEKIYVDTEDESDYETSRINTEDLYNICSHLYNVVNVKSYVRCRNS